ncbi:hypothetical protein EELLY_v1c03400 [Entomoplasma ellychniae]|uniref:Uncharacterized protein n=2 Tax=Entomoplasma ellychniae TaxID=2114 RepID=A0A8E2QZD2_9MOLU|nr:hypothetical protein EELLY_v1c03400 [Entomoplasma ellychniae]
MKDFTILITESWFFKMAYSWIEILQLIVAFVIVITSYCIIGFFIYKKIRHKYSVLKLVLNTALLFFSTILLIYTLLIMNILYNNWAVANYLTLFLEVVCSILIVIIFSFKTAK